MISNAENAYELFHKLSKFPLTIPTHADEALAVLTNCKTNTAIMGNSNLLQNIYKFAEHLFFQLSTANIEDQHIPTITKIIETLIRYASYQLPITAK